MVSERSAGLALIMSLGLGGMALSCPALARSGEASKAPLAESVEQPCGARTGFWLRAARATSDRYCRLVDRARARLTSDPAQARDLAESAILSRAPAMEARLLLVQARLFLGEAKKAHEIFSSLVATPNAPELAELLSPHAVVSGARAALLSGDYEAALARYRWVTLRLGDFESPHEEARILIEAATAAMYSGPGKGLEATAYLVQAVQKNAPLMRPIAEAAFALALYRDGQVERAARISQRFPSSWPLVWKFSDQDPALGLPREAIPVLPPGESWAMAAVVAEAVEKEAAPLHWAEFAEAARDLPAHLAGPLGLSSRGETNF